MASPFLATDALAKAMLEALTEQLEMSRLVRVLDEERRHGANLSHVVALAEGRAPEINYIKVKRPQMFGRWDLARDS